MKLYQKKITTGNKKLNLLVFSNYLRRPVLVRIHPTTVEIKLEKKNQKLEENNFFYKNN